jgi:putative oxidoreductase
MTSPNLDARLNTYSPAVVSLFRVIVGLLFALHGSSKLFDWPLKMPMPISVGDWPSWWAGLIELVTGLLVAAGLFTRPAAFIASGEMAVAYFWQHLLDPPPEIPKSFWPPVNMGEPAVIYCFAFLLLVFIGPGAYAVDTMRRRRVVSGTAAPVGRRTGRPGLLSRFRRR